MLLINTRPVERSAPLTQLLHQHGIRTFSLPLLALTPVLQPATTAQYMRDWQAGCYDALVVISPTAAQHALATLDLTDFLPPDTPILAVGSATAAVLHEAGWQTLQPEQMSNEGMLQMPVVKGLHAGSRVLIWRGQGGRRLLSDSLQDRGVTVDAIAWYERVLPKTAAAALTLLAQLLAPNTNTPLKSSLNNAKPTVLISSAMAFAHWQQLLANLHPVQIDSSLTKASANSLNCQDFQYIVLGARLAAMLDAEQLDYQQVADLQPERILAVLQAVNPTVSSCQPDGTHQLR